MSNCEWCGASSEHAAPGVPCYRCLFRGAGDARSGYRKPRHNFDAELQDKILGVVREPYIPELENVEQILALFTLNITELQ